MHIKRRKLFLRDFLTTLFRHWRLEGALLFLAVLFGFLGNYLIPTTYRARATLLIRADSDLTQDAAIRTLTDRDFLSHVVEHVGNNSLAQYHNGMRASLTEIVHRLGARLLLEPPSTPTVRTVQALSEHLQVEPGLNSRLLHLSLTANDPEFAADALAHYARAVVELHRDAEAQPAAPQPDAATDVARATAKLNAFQAQYDVDALSERYAALQDEIEVLRAQARETPDAEALQKVSAADEQLTSIETLLTKYESLEDEVVAAGAAAQLREPEASAPPVETASSTFSIITPATISISPLYPDWSRNLLWSLGIGLALALIGGLFAQWLNHGILFPEDLEERMDVPVLGSFFRADETHDSVERYRMLCGRMRNHDPHAKMRMWLVTSATEAENAEEVAAAIAKAMAEDPRAKVLHIDLGLKADSANGTPGFADVILDRATLDDAMTNGIAHNLRSVPRGAPEVHSPLIFTSDDAHHQWQVLREQFTDVIVSTPPVLTSSEAVAIGALCDSVLLVVRAEVVRAEVVSRALQVLDGANAPIGGAVLTNRHTYIPHALYKRI